MRDGVTMVGHSGVRVCDGVYDYGKCVRGCVRDCPCVDLYVSVGDGARVR